MLGRVFEGLIVLDPNLYFGHAGLGALALRDEKLDQAVRHLTEPAELQPEDPAVHANLGEALLRQRRVHGSGSRVLLDAGIEP